MTLAPLTGIGLAVYGIDTHQSHESLDSLSVDRVVDSTIDLIPQHYGYPSMDTLCEAHPTAGTRPTLVHPVHSF